MDLRQLRYFVEIANLRSVTAAAARVFVAQSALSRQLKLLEDELGVSLLARQARGVRLTDAGEAFLTRAQILLRDADNLKAEFRAHKREPSGRLQIGAPPSLRAMLVAPFAAQFTSRHPKVTLAFREGTSHQICDLLAQGEIDLAIVSNQEEISSFATRTLLTEPLCWVGPPEAALSFSRTVSISRLASKPLILTSYPNSLRVIVDRALAEGGIRVEPIAEADMVSMMLDLIRRGMGFTVLPVSAVDDLRKQRICSASRVRGLSISWVIAWSKERTRTPVSREASDHIDRLAAQKIDSGEWPFARLTARAGS